MANVQVVRRTNKEIAAGFPQELKKKGVKFEGWLKDQKLKKKKATPKNGKPKTSVSLTGIVRRTKEEIKAGFPLEEKREGVTLKEWQAKREKKIAEVKKQRKTIKIDPPPQLTPTKREPEPKIEYVKHVEKIIVQTKDNEKELKELIYQAMDRCTWEWKQVPMDKDFKVSDLNKYGKEDWKFAFIHNVKMHDSKTTKPDIICFQRPKQIK